MRFRHVIYLLLIACLTGCAAAGALSSVANVAMNAAGLKKQEVPDAQKPPRTIQINLSAEKTLNVDANGRSLALVVRIYKLKQNSAFEQATYETFLDPEKEKATLGTDLLEVKEVVLIPGQQYKATEKVSHEAYFIGVVALFHSPLAQNWRATFSAPAVEKTGISLSVRACSLALKSTEAAKQQKVTASNLVPEVCN